MLIDICMKFREGQSSKGNNIRVFQVTERTRFVTDRQTDGQTDARGKTICLPTLRGRHNSYKVLRFVCVFPQKFIGVNTERKKGLIDMK